MAETATGGLHEETPCHHEEMSTYPPEMMATVLKTGKIMLVNEFKQMSSNFAILLVSNKK